MAVSSETRIGIWHAFSLVAVVAAILGALWLVFEEFGKTTEEGLAILGVVIPGLVTIGAAVFGVTAYAAGNASGQAAGNERAREADARVRANADDAAKAEHILEDHVRRVAALEEVFASPDLQWLRDARPDIADPSRSPDAGEARAALARIRARSEVS